MIENDDFFGSKLVAGYDAPEDDADLPFDADIYYNRTPISYGVELQFLVPVRLATQPDPNPNDPRQAIVVDENTTYEAAEQLTVDHILHLLRGAGIPAWTHDGPQPSHDQISKMDKESQALANMPAYAQWVVKTDPELVPADDLWAQTYRWIGIKLKSNKRNSRWDNHFDQIGNVIILLRANLRMRLTPTTTLSVHVGENERDYMTYDYGIRFFRVFCTLWWFVEKHVQTLAHPSRADHDACRPLKEYSRFYDMGAPEFKQYLLDYGIPDNEFTHNYKQMHYILPLSTITGREELEVNCIWRTRLASVLTQHLTVQEDRNIRMASTGQVSVFPTRGRGSIGFQGFCQDANPEDRAVRHNNGESGTVEFRQMEGTLDPLLIANWLVVVIRLYDFARRGNTADIMALIDQSTMDDGSYTGLELLRDLDIPEQVGFFMRKAQSDAQVVVETLETLFVPAYPPATNWP